MLLEALSVKLLKNLKNLISYGCIKSYVVSLRYVKNIFKGVITMENGVKIYVSKYRSKEVYELLMQYIEAGYGS